MRVLHLHIRPLSRALSVTFALAALAAAPTALSCADPSVHALALGEHTVQTQRNSPALVRVDQLDLDIRIAVASGKQTSHFDGPGGRNGPEWIYLSSDAPMRHRLCFYAVYGQGTSDAYRISSVPLSSLSAPDRAALRLLSEGSKLWASDRLSSRMKAIEIYERVARLGVDRFDASSYALLYSALARTQRYQHEQALPVLEQLGSNKNAPAYVRYMAQWSNGFILIRAGEVSRGRVLLEAALATALDYAKASQRSLRRDIAEITNLLGEVQLTSGDLDDGERLITQALQLAQDDYQLRAWIFNNLGYVHLRHADLDAPETRSKHLARSIEAHSKARDFAARAGDDYELSHIQNNLATLFERVGDLRSARRYFESALQLIDETDDPYHFKMLYRGLGNIYLTLGDYAKSERFLEASLAIGGSAFEDHDARLYCRLGVVKRLQQKLSAAIAAHTACRERSEARDNIPLQADALQELSIDYALQNLQSEAWESILRAKALLSQTRDRDVRSKVMAQHAWLLHRRGEKDAARSRIQEAIEAAVLARYATTKIDALSAAANIYYEQGLKLESRSFALLAISAIEAVHAHLDAERLGPAWSARTQDVYVRLASDLLEDGSSEHVVEAFEVVERSRAISLRQQYAAPEQRTHEIADDPMLIALSDLANQSATAANQSVGMPLAYYHEHDLLTLSRLSGAGDLPVPAPLDVRSMQQSLGEQQLALSYFRGKTSLYLFAIGKQTFEVLDLGDAKSIERLVGDVRELISQRDRRATTALRKLSRRILPVSRLPNSAADCIIVGDGALHLLPFGALDVGNDAEPYTPAAEHFTFRMAPSLSAYFMSKRSEPRSYAADLAILADPAFQKDRGTAGDDRHREPSERSGWIQGLRRLPWTAEEARRLSSLFPAARTFVLTDINATRQNLRSERVRNSRILHIASHGYFESSNPDNVGFALSPSRTAAGLDSGFVTLTELFSYRFNNELVVISGCDTAVGTERGGEGLISLTRGFIAQGASHVLSTQWSVSDRASAEFMTRFYQHIVSGQSAGQALRLAQADLRKVPVFRDPFFWAAYTLTSVAPDDGQLRSTPRVSASK